MDLLKKLSLIIVFLTSMCSMETWDMTIIRDLDMRMIKGLDMMIPRIMILMIMVVLRWKIQKILLGVSFLRTSLTLRFTFFENEDKTNTDPPLPSSPTQAAKGLVTPPPTPESLRKRHSRISKFTTSTPTRLGKVLQKASEHSPITTIKALGSKIKFDVLAAMYKEFVTTEGLSPVTEKDVKDHVNRCIHVANHFILTSPSNATQFAGDRDRIFDLMFAQEEKFEFLIRFY
jgi:hypothetical protein